jgi:hypothetical protein
MSTRYISMTYEYANGNTYIVWDAHYEEICHRIQPLLDSGFKCCLFTKSNPMHLSNINANLKIFWVSDEKEAGAIPMRPEYLMRDYENTIKESKGNVVVIFDVFDSLIALDGKRFTMVYTLLNQMIDMTAMTKNILFVPITSKLLTESEKSLILGTPVKEMELDSHKQPRPWLFRKKGTSDGYRIKRNLPSLFYRHGKRL